MLHKLANNLNEMQTKEAQKSYRLKCYEVTQKQLNKPLLKYIKVY